MAAISAAAPRSVPAEDNYGKVVEVGDAVYFKDDLGNTFTATITEIRRIDDPDQQFTVQLEDGVEQRCNKTRISFIPEKGEVYYTKKANTKIIVNTSSFGKINNTNRSTISFSSSNKPTAFGGSFTPLPQQPRRSRRLQQTPGQDLLNAVTSPEASPEERKQLLLGYNPSTEGTQLQGIGEGEEPLAIASPIPVVEDVEDLSSPQASLGGATIEGDSPPRDRLTPLQQEIADTQQTIDRLKSVLETPASSLNRSSGLQPPRVTGTPDELVERADELLGESRILEERANESILSTAESTDRPRSTKEAEEDLLRNEIYIQKEKTKAAEIRNIVIQNELDKAREDAKLQTREHNETAAYFNGEIERLKEEARQSDAALGRTTFEIKQRDKEIQEQRQVIAEIQAKLGKASSLSLRASDAVEAELEEKKVLIADLENQRTKLKAENQQEIDDRIAIQEMLQSLQQDKDREYQTYNEQREKLTSEIAKLSEDLVKSVESQKSGESELATLRNEIKAAKEETERTRTIKEREIEDVRRELAEKELQLGSTEADREAQLRSLRSALDKKTEDTESYDRRNARLNAEVSRLEAQLKNTVGVDPDVVKRLEEAHIKVVNQLKEAQNENSAIKERASEELSEMQKGFEETIVDYEETIENLEAELEDIAEKNHFQLQNALIKLGDAEEEIEELKQEQEISTRAIEIAIQDRIQDLDEIRRLKNKLTVANFRADEGAETTRRLTNKLKVRDYIIDEKLTSDIDDDLSDYEDIDDDASSVISTPVSASGTGCRLQVQMIGDFWKKMTDEYKAAGAAV